MYRKSYLSRQFFRQPSGALKRESVCMCSKPTYYLYPIVFISFIYFFTKLSGMYVPWGEFKVEVIFFPRGAPRGTPMGWSPGGVPGGGPGSCSGFPSGEKI